MNPGNRGYFAIGIENAKNRENVGTLWRGAQAFGAAYTFTIGQRIKPQASDVTNSWKHLPHYEFKGLDEFLLSRPKDSLLIGVEVDGNSIEVFSHPERAIYVLGPEDGSLSKEMRSKCQGIISIPTKVCLNVSQAGTIIMYDRLTRNRATGISLRPDLMASCIHKWKREKVSGFVYGRRCLKCGNLESWDIPRNGIFEDQEEARERFDRNVMPEQEEGP